MEKRAAPSPARPELIDGTTLLHSGPIGASFPFNVAFCSMRRGAWLLHGSLQRKSRTKKKKEAHGSGMLCAITANDMPPCKLWP